MRLIVREQDYEKPVAAGAFRYALNGRPTGTIEHWRLTQATAGYEVLRVDVDGQDGPERCSYLYHLLRQSNGRPERLAFRFWNAVLRVEGTLLFAPTHIVGSRMVNGRYHEEDLDLEADTPFWFPSAVGLGLAAQFKGAEVGIPAMTLNDQLANQETLALQPVTVYVTQVLENEVAIANAGAVMVRWNGRRCILLQDNHSWPTAIEWPDTESGERLTAVATHATRY